MVHIQREADVKFGIRGGLARPSEGRQSAMERFHPPLTILWLGSSLLVGLLPTPGLNDPIFIFNLLKEWSKMPTLLLLDSGEGEFPLSFQFSVHLFGGSLISSERSMLNK